MCSGAEKTGVMGAQSGSFTGQSYKTNLTRRDFVRSPTQQMSGFGRLASAENIGSGGLRLINPVAISGRLKPNYCLTC